MEPHIMNSVREVVGLHKERRVFPVNLCGCSCWLPLRRGCALWCFACPQPRFAALSGLRPPSSAGVTRLSGTGNDCVFLGVLRPVPFSAHDVCVWCAPTGHILCASSYFSSLVGEAAEDTIGSDIKDVIGDAEGLQAIFDKAMEVSAVAGNHCCCAPAVQQAAGG